ncbi:MAG TPA: hypothetical protein VHG91_13945 [Longimicrobium sp.]|nr:hypothetical protein [Longimicrobium sp.]
MGLREFTDSQGTAWSAWDVPPLRVYTPARAGADRRTRETPGYAPERRVWAERRRRASGLEGGWLCFRSEAEKRRLASPPEGWEEACEEELEALCRRAAPAPTPR